MDVPPNSAGSERAKEFARLAETRFGQPMIEKVRNDFFDGLLKMMNSQKVLPPA